MKETAGAGGHGATLRGLLAARVGRGGAAPVPIPFPGTPLRATPPRVPPGGRREIGPLNALVCALAARGGGVDAPHVFTTLARHRRLFRPWLRFAARLMPFGTLSRTDAELVILRVAVLCGSDYEWHQHVALGQRAGLTAEQVARVGDGPDAAGWDDRERLLLRAADELVRERTLSAPTWAALAERYEERQRIELCMLAGHYAMLAGTLNAVGVEPERAG
nr:carboxymuconolactone decarboxylase family protein [Conexibacter woesei]